MAGIHMHSISSPICRENVFMRARFVFVTAGAAIVVAAGAIMAIPSANASVPPERGLAAQAAADDAPLDEADYAELAAEGDQLDAALAADPANNEPDPDADEISTLAATPCDKYIQKKHTYRSVWTFVTDDQGRPNTAASKHLRVATSPRDKACETKVGNFAGNGYDGGHMIASTLRGTSKRFNLLPETESANRGAAKAIENSAKRCMLKGAVTNYVTQAWYPNNTSVVPNRITMAFHVTISGHAPGPVGMETANNVITKRTMKLIKANIRAYEKKVGCV
jgi:hypothetical protein